MKKKPSVYDKVLLYLYNNSGFFMFKKQYIYGRTLLYLYNNPDGRYDISYLLKQFPDKVDSFYFSTVIEWLVNDNLIVKETHAALKDFKKFENVDYYRISHQGFTFINDLKHKRKSRIINSIAIVAACLGIIANVWVNISVLNNKNALTKVEITNPVKIQAIARDTAKTKRHKEPIKTK